MKTYTPSELAALEAAWAHYGRRGKPWAQWKAERLNDMFTRVDRGVSTPNFRPETVEHGERSRDIPQ